MVAIGGHSLVTSQYPSNRDFTHVNILGTDFFQHNGVVKIENYPKMEPILLFIGFGSGRQVSEGRYFNAVL